MKVASLDGVFVVATDSYELWLVNQSAKAIDLGAMELFGLSTGTFVQKAAGSGVSLLACLKSHIVKL